MQSYKLGCFAQDYRYVNMKCSVALSSVGAPETAHELIRAVRVTWLERMISKKRVRTSETTSRTRDVQATVGMLGAVDRRT
jgi:hypothetical protein